MRSLLLLAICVLAGAICGCSTLIDSRPPGEWYDAYEPIEQAAVTEFVDAAFAEACNRFGDPEVPVNTLLLRRSRKAGAAKAYRLSEDFSLTQCVDTNAGLFVIYIGVDVEHPNFYPLLGHEVVHLLNARISDWYMEGIATQFSHEICMAQGRSWGDWERRFKTSRRDPYARSYRMMRDLKELVPEAYDQLPHFAINNRYGSRWQCLDFNGWLASLSRDEAEKAVIIIEPHVKVLGRRVNQQYSFQSPLLAP